MYLKNGSSSYSRQESETTIIKGHAINGTENKVTKKIKKLT